MRELHAWLDDRRHGADAPAEARAAHASDRHRPDARLDVEARVAKALEYRKAVEEAYAQFEADKFNAQGARPERALFEARDKPASKIAERRDALESQQEERRRPERSRLPSNETTQFAAGIGIMASSIADALNVMPGKIDAVAASFLGAVVAGVAWGNKRWKDKHGDRPES